MEIRKFFASFPLNIKFQVSLIDRDYLPYFHKPKRPRFAGISTTRQRALDGLPSGA
jgi:hypothetical protein